MKIDIVNNALPPRQDAIGQYTGKIASALAGLGHEVRVLVEEGYSYDPIPNVLIIPAFRTDPVSGTQGLVAAIQQGNPDWVLLQYNPFSYGRRGFNPVLPGVLATVKRKVPGLRVAVMAHETFVPWNISLPFLVMASWQRPQFRRIGLSADVIFISIEGWANDLKSWFPRKTLHHVPVPSLIPRVSIEREEARNRLGIASSAPVLGVFGTAHVSRLLPMLKVAVERARAVRDDVRVVYIGPDRAAFEPLFGSVGIYTDGHVDDSEVSRRFAAMDITLSTFVDGVSSRRSSLMTGLQHGIAAVGTIGINTDSLFIREAEDGPVLVDASDVDGFAQAMIRLIQDPDERKRVAEHGHRLYEENYALEGIAKKIDAVLTKVS